MVTEPEAPKFARGNDRRRPKRDNSKKRDDRRPRHEIAPRDIPETVNNETVKKTADVEGGN